tara:strand:- start:453 stop:1103 length:651 start_codon:yes stop_codon:yes gene_type:complete
MNTFILDYETTGLNPYHHELIELAIKKLDEDHYYQTLIKPSINGIHYKYISEKINKITGITDEMIESDGIDENIAFYNMIQYISNHSEEGPIYLLAHNGTTFDFIFFKKQLLNYEMDNTKKTRSTSIDHDIINRIVYLDTLLMARMVINDGSCSQYNLCKRYNIINESEHRALGDINALEKIYKKLCINLSYTNNSNTDIYINDPKTIVDKINFKV